VLLIGSVIFLNSGGMQWDLSDIDSRDLVIFIVGNPLYGRGLQKKKCQSLAVSGFLYIVCTAYCIWSVIS